MRFDVVLALLVSTIRAMRRPLWRGTSDRIDSTLFSYILVSNFRQRRSRLATLVNGIRMNIPQNNPYRLLGVYSNSPTKERLANHNRMKAFLKVGKPVSFPLDLSQYLPVINRTETSVVEAEAKLTLPKDQILYAQFWFIKTTPLDDVAFNHLFAGEIDKAEDIWRKRDCASSLQNRIVCAIISKNYESVISCAEVLYSNTPYISQFVSAIIGTDGNIDVTNLAFSFLDVLCEDLGANRLLPFITIDAWKNHIGEKAVKPLVDSIQGAIDIAKKSKGKGSNARLNAGETLRKNTRNLLLQLKGFLSIKDLQYQLIVDKLGLEILQCGIDYYNGSEEPDAAHKAMSLQKYAKSIVVGQMAKDRCKENVDILQKIIDNLPPTEVFEEDRAIREELRKYCLLPDKICHAITLLNNTKSYLQSIRRILGASNSYYLKISTLVVRNALSNVIAEVNEAQSLLSVDKDDPNAKLAAFLGIAHLKSVLEEAWKATKLMDGFDMETDYKSGRYSVNRSTLKELCGNLDIPTEPIPTPVPQNPTPPGPVPEEPKPNIGCFLGILFVTIGAAILGTITESGGGAIFGGIIGLGLWSKISD